MGIYDREYYRDETRGSGFFSGTAPATKAIIFLNVLIFLASALFAGTQALIEHYFAARSDLIFQHFQVYRLLTATFLHADLLHLAFNMLVLWWAGREMEPIYGSREFALFYVTAAVFSTLCWAGADARGVFAGMAPMIGASGAVMAVVVLYALYYPHRELMFWGIVRVEIWMLLLIYIASDLFSLLQQFQSGLSAGIAFGSHLGGALYGYLYKSYDLRWTRLISAVSMHRKRSRFRVISPEPRERDRDRDTGTPLSSPTPVRSAGSASARVASPVAVEEQLDAKLDEVLAKIAREGRGNLTEDDQRILDEASRRARSRRGNHL